MIVLSLNIRGIRKDGKARWIRSLCGKENPWVTALQETRCGTYKESFITYCWGSSNFKYVQKDPIGFSGGSLLIWNPTIIKVNEAIEGEFFLAIKGKIEGIDPEVAIVNVYGPHSTPKKIRFWDSLEALISQINMPWLICEDFNEVRSQSERFNCEFNPNWANRFNDIINRLRLIDIPLGGKKFTRVCDNGITFSKLDRFLISEEFNQ
ncbi:uncharacterized protein [Rutidosis leptorrhynchoides]|uniref:uncharacterized protein n=1 Tax=Rutidosis leptorrhynchoides TaxID=125765 RepID=UPI003A9A3B2E